jgi:hypothetical protein
MSEKVVQHAFGMKMTLELRGNAFLWEFGGGFDVLLEV